MAELTSGFDCPICHQHHPTLPLSFSIKAPDAAIRIPAAGQAARVVLSADQCVVDNTAFYLRGRILLPILDFPGEPFVWGLWAEVGPKDFIRTQAMWKQSGRESEPPFRGYLDSELFLYPSTVNLEVAVQTQVVGRRPHFQLLSANHPLAREQRAGITLDRVRQIAATLFHRAAS